VAYVIPEGSSNWPEELCGMNLGTTVDSIRNRNAYADYKEELLAMDFDYSSQANEYGWENMKLALETHRKFHGDLRVKSKFVVPTNDSAWPGKIWGMNLGMIVSNIRNNDYYADHREEELIAMGFDFSPQPIGHGWDNVKLALDIYKRLYGDLLVPSKFMVPEDDSAWPNEIWGMRLGESVSRIRSDNAYEDHREELVAMGFDYCSQSKSHSWATMKLALETYKKLYGSLLVPQSFMVPEELWGMNLGKLSVVFVRVKAM
jgi:hypothetical protein